MAMVSQASLAARLVGKGSHAPRKRQPTFSRPRYCAKTQIRTNCSVRSRVYKCEPVEVERLGCPDLETRRGMVAERPQLCVDVMCCGLWLHEKNARRKTLELLGACPHDPPCRVRSIVGCVIHARTLEPCVRLLWTESARNVTVAGFKSRAEHPNQKTRRLTSASLHHHKTTPLRMKECCRPSSDDLGSRTKRRFKRVLKR